MKKGAKRKISTFELIIFLYYGVFVDGLFCHDERDERSFMIKELSNNKFKITYEVGTRGNRHRNSETFIGTRAQAIKRERELIVLKGKKRKDNDPTITFKLLSEIFITKHCKENLGPKTINGYESLLKDINKYIGNLKIKDIDFFVVENLYDRLKYGERRRIRSKNTLKHYYNLVNIIFNKAIQWSLIDNNPNLKFQISKKYEENNNLIVDNPNEVRCYSDDEMLLLLKNSKNDTIFVQTLVSLAFDSGMRKSEQLGLTWEKINWKNNSILVDHTVDVINGKWVVKPPKNRNSIRTIIISETNMNLLKKLREEQMNNIVGWCEKDYVFRGKNDNKMPIYPTTCNTILERLAIKSNLPIHNWHSIRHTTASWLSACGVPVKDISNRLGHSRVSTTYDIYCSIFEKNQILLANKINSKLKTIF